MKYKSSKILLLFWHFNINWNLPIIFCKLVIIIKENKWSNPTKPVTSIADAINVTTDLFRTILCVLASYHVAVCSIYDVFLQHQNMYTYILFNNCKHMYKRNYKVDVSLIIHVFSRVKDGREKLTVTRRVSYTRGENLSQLKVYSTVSFV